MTYQESIDISIDKFIETSKNLKGKLIIENEKLRTQISQLKTEYEISLQKKEQQFNGKLEQMMQEIRSLKRTNQELESKHGMTQRSLTSQTKKLEDLTSNFTIVRSKADLYEKKLQEEKETSQQLTDRLLSENELNKNIIQEKTKLLSYLEDDLQKSKQEVAELKEKLAEQKKFKPINLRNREVSAVNGPTKIDWQQFGKLTVEYTSMEANEFVETSTICLLFIELETTDRLRISDKLNTLLKELKNVKLIVISTGITSNNKVVYNYFCQQTLATTSVSTSLNIRRSMNVEHVPLLIVIDCHGDVIRRDALPDVVKQPPEVAQLWKVALVDDDEFDDVVDL